MPQRFKKRVDFSGEMAKVARRRVNDTKTPIGSRSTQERMALDYLRFRSRQPPTNSVKIDRLADSINTTNYIKDFKFHIGSLNAQINKVTDLTRMNTKDIFSTLHEIQRQVYKLDAEVGEIEIKMLNGFSKVHLNTFVRQMDAQLQYADSSWLEDFKTSFTYPEKYLLHLLPSAGLTLPRKYQFTIPITDAYIVDEATDVGETLTPVISNSPRNVFLENKIFRHILIRRNFDSTSRKYKAKTAYDDYPYSAVSTMTLELVLPNVCSINYLTINPVNAAVFSIKDISYLNEAGELVSIVSQSITNDLVTTYLFDPVYTKYFRVTFEQTSPVTKTTVTIGDAERDAINEILEGAGFSAELDSSSETITGRWYDFSIKDIEVGEIGYENKGIFRSRPIKVKSPIGLEVSRYMEAITPEEVFSEYYKTISLPEGRAHSEAYIGVRLYNKRKGCKVDALVPVYDSYPTQIEYLDFLHTDARVKLFPDFQWHLNEICVDDARAEEYCISLDDLVEGDQYESEETYAALLSAPDESPSQASITSEESFCLLGGERVVRTKLGDSTPIEDIEVGDTVFTYDYNTGKAGDYSVVGLIRGTSSTWLEMHFEYSDRPIRCSPTHHMLDEDFQQIAASSLDIGDLIWIYEEGELKQVEIIDIILHKQVVDVFNIEIDEAHTYITSNGVYQHNKLAWQDTFGDAEGSQKATVAASSQESDVANRSYWAKKYTSPRVTRSRSKVEKTGQTTSTKSALGTIIGTAWDNVSTEQQDIILANPDLIAKALDMDGRLMIGSDGVKPGYTRVTPSHMKGRDLNFIDRAFWNTKLAEVHVSETDSVVQNQKAYIAEIKVPRKGLEDHRLQHLSVRDRITVQRLSRVQRIASELKDVTPGRSTGAFNIIKTLDTKENLNLLNSLVASVLSPKIGYKLNSRNAYEIDIVDEAGGSDVLYNKTWAVASGNKTRALSSSYKTWSTFGGMVDEYDKDFAYTTGEGLDSISDCVWFLTFTTPQPHGLIEGDMVTLGSPDERFNGIYVVATVPSDTTFSIPLDAFTDLVYTLGLSIQSPGGEVWSAKTAYEYAGVKLSAGISTPTHIGVASIVDDTSPDGDDKRELARGINTSLNQAYMEGTFGDVSTLFDASDPVVEVKLEASKLPDGITYDAGNPPPAPTGSLVSTGSVTFTDWVYNPVSSPPAWASTMTVNNVDEVREVDNVLSASELLALNTVKICVYATTSVEDPIEVYEDERLLVLGVDYSVSLDDKSTWYDYFLGPGEDSYLHLNQRAKAGRFYVRVHNRNPNAIYWIKYRIKRHQALSACELIRLKNGRVIFDKSLRDTFGTLQTVFIFRTNSTNPYITPILREYVLKVQEKKTDITESNTLMGEVKSRETASRRNVP